MYTMKSENDDAWVCCVLSVMKRLLRLYISGPSSVPTLTLRWQMPPPLLVSPRHERPSTLPGNTWTSVAAFGRYTQKYSIST